ncbi:MAG: sugar-binding protein [Planctomycetaceae bacterium]|nr:sugar-binding protein [Planctomycetaceae bacterium]
MAGLACLVGITGCNGNGDGGSGAGGTTGGAAEQDEFGPIKTGSVGEDEKPTVSFVTNGIASFWVVAEAGANKAAEDVNADVLVKMPAEGVADQKRILEDLLTQGVDGVAVSAIDPSGQQDILNEVGENTIFITHDSDSPFTNRCAYIGMDNYDAGRMAGKLVKEAIPDGGEVMIFVGRLEQLNAKLRRQGVIDELLDREPDSSRYDEPGKPVEGEKYTILDTRTDGFDFAKAKAEAQDAINKYPDLKCMVGLFAYNPPLMLEAVKEAGKTDDIEIVAFDEEDGTLQGIVDGHIHGTVVQNPYEYGYQSVKMLAELARGDSSSVPEDRFMNIPARQIRKDNVIEFWTELNQLLGKEPPEGAAETSKKEGE